MELTKSNYESTNPVFTNICYDFSNGENGEEKKTFCTHKNFVFFKGQLISKCPFGVKTSSKNPMKLFPGLLP